MIVVKPGRYGPYVKRGDDTASVPDDVAPDEMTVDKALELLSAPQGDRELGVDPETGLTVFAKPGRFGPYVQLGELVDGLEGEAEDVVAVQDDGPSSRISLDDALRLLSLPRVVGTDPEPARRSPPRTGATGRTSRRARTAAASSTRSRSSRSTVDEALRIYAEPKRGRGQRVTAPLKELGDDPVSREAGGGQGRSVRPVRHRRRDQRVAAQATTASRPSPIERAAELLQDRRDRGPAKKKKAAAKKATKKKAAKKKAPAKKAAAKKS